MRPARRRGQSAATPAKPAAVPVEPSCRPRPGVLAGGHLGGPGGSDRRRRPAGCRGTRAAVHRPGGGGGGPAMPPALDLRRAAGESERAARALLGRFAPGEHVAVWAPNLPEWVILSSSAPASPGSTLVTVNPACGRASWRYVLRAVARRGHLPRARASAATAMAEHRSSRCAADAPRAARGRLVRRLGRRSSRRPSRPGVARRDPDDPAQIQYTSGTTGVPKGACCTTGDGQQRAAVRRPAGRSSPATSGSAPCRCSTPPGASWRARRGRTAATLVLPPRFDPGLHARADREERADTLAASRRC